MIRFIEDLGIVPNKGKPFEHDPSLKQGQKMMEYERIYTFFNTNRIKNLELKTYPSKKHNVKTIVETMESIESASKDNNTSDIVIKNTPSLNEQKFYKLLSEYSNTSKMSEREMIENNGTVHLFHETLEKQYDNLLSISSVIEKELNPDKMSSDNNNNMIDELLKRKYELAFHLNKLKKSRRGKSCGCEKGEKEQEPTKDPTNNIYDQAKIVVVAFGVILLLYKISSAK